MLVYGDSHAEEALCDAAQAVGALVQDCLRAAGASRLDCVRDALIACGQLEQGVLDALPAPDAVRPVLQLTTALADLFWTTYAERHVPGAARLEPARVMREVRAACAGLGELPSLRVTLKTPEGFAYYALHPEQYAHAACAWLADHASAQPKSALVLGLRSIGTTLGAVVAAVLRAHGHHVNVCSARPHGHVFARALSLPRGIAAGSAFALAVDEGPGLSGSSLAAAVRALREAGFAPQRIAIFASHERGPGPEASGATRGVWQTTRRYFVPLDGTSRRGTWGSELCAQLQARCGDAFEVGELRELGGGRWRDLLLPERAAAPAACVRFERDKYLVTTRSAGRWLLKFAGLGRAPGTRTSLAQAQAQTLRARSLSPSDLQPLTTLGGYLVLPWVAGTPLDRSALDDGFLHCVARHIVNAARPADEHADQEQELLRLRVMIEHNLREAFGERAADRFASVPIAHWRAAQLATRLRYGDGHLAPHEWIRRRDGAVAKVDSVGHCDDHTLVGSQSLLWDVAGFRVEWALDRASCTRFQHALVQAGGEAPAQGALALYELAYAAFRMGLCGLCAELESEQAERVTLLAQSARYRRQAARALASCASS